jgi:T5orf172 domain-containing protein
MQGRTARSGSEGYVYILVNPAFTGYVKVGKTAKDPDIRARELSSSTGVPAPYAVAWDAFVSDCHHVERLVHLRLANARARNDREFFAIPLREAVWVLAEVATPCARSRGD